MKQWVRIRSLHLNGRITSEGIKTFCGLRIPVDAPQFDVRPEGKTCETCLRIQVGR